MSELHRQGILTGFAVVRRIDGENVFLPSGQLCRVVHPGAVDFHGMDAAQGTDQPFLVELTVIHFHEVHHTLQDCGTEGIGFALPCVHNQPQSLAVDFLAHLVVQLECSAYAADAVVAQLQAVIVEVQTHPVGGCEECHGKSMEKVFAVWLQMQNYTEWIGLTHHYIVPLIRKNQPLEMEVICIA